MSYAARVGYEFLGDIEIRILQDTGSEVARPDFAEQRSIFSTIPQKTTSTTFNAFFKFPDGDSYSCALPDLPNEELSATSDPRAYGQRLFDWLFNREMKERYFKIRRSAEFFANDSVTNFNGLRLRLWLDPYSIKLHRIWWEAMYDPEQELPLSASMAFSRFMSGSGGRPNSPISKGSLRLLLVASNPEQLRRLELEDINLSLEKSIITHATEPLGESLKVEKYMPNVTVDGLARKQAAEGFQIVHILTHTVVKGERSFMVLADDNGKAQEVDCQQVVSALTSTEALPHLVFLATPMAAEYVTGPALVTMSPWLVDAGVRAAIAIQGPIREDRLVTFCNCFYETLITTGVIDVALMVARGAIFDPSCWEWANAVLYMRTPSGELFRPLPENLRGLVSAAAAL